MIFILIWRILDSAWDTDVIPVYQLSAQFPGPTAPREFITLLLTSPNCLSNESKVGDIMPRHYLIVSIPVSHPDAPPRDGMVRGQYESVEMIREIPLAPFKTTTSGGADAKGNNIDRKDQADEDDPETNPVEWIMITRSDPGGGIPRFMVERSTPSSIVQDAAKFLNWACSEEDFPSREDEPSQPSEPLEQPSDEHSRTSMDRQPRLSIAENNGILAGVGTSIADNPLSVRRLSQRALDGQASDVTLIPGQTDAAISQTMSSLHRSNSQSSTTTSLSSVDSFASAEQFNTASEGLPLSSSLSTMSDQSAPLGSSESSKSSAHINDRHNRELAKIEEKRAKLKEKLQAARTKAIQDAEKGGEKSAKEIEKAQERHEREKKKQEARFKKETQKLEQRRERETKKLLARQQKEADKAALNKAQREKDEYKSRAELAEQELKILREQLGALQRENTALVAHVGKVDGGMDLVKRVREELGGKGGRSRSGSKGGSESGNGSGMKEKKNGTGYPREGSALANVEDYSEKS